MKNDILRGTLTALVTPFNDDAERSVDFDSLARLIDWQLEKKVDGFVTCGTSGESATMSVAERIEVIKFTIERTRGRIPVIAGTGSNNTRASIEFTQKAKELGADAALVVSPYYNRPTQEGLIAHFTAVTENGGLPVVLYNIPGRTAVTIATDTFKKLRDLTGVIGVKESGGSGDALIELAGLAGPDFSIVSGDDSWIFLTMAAGGTGVISASSNAVPEQINAITVPALAGNYVSAREAQIAALPAIRAMFSETNPVPAKTALRLRGIIKCDLPRLPLVPLRPENLSRLETMFRG